MHFRAFLAVSTGTTGESTFPIAIRIATAFGKDELAEPPIACVLFSSVETFHRLNTSVGKKFSSARSANDLHRDLARVVSDWPIDLFALVAISSP
jgi:hypothetical protein